MTTDFISYSLGFLVLLSHLFLIVYIPYFLINLKSKNKIISFVGRNSLIFSFIVALSSMLGSLFYSDIIGYNPCKLCWYQRIFMYSLVFILPLAIYKKDKKIIPYALLLSIIGIFVSIYHNIIYISKTSTVFCTATESCIKKYVNEFGYISIPLMALTAFALIITFLITEKYYKAQK